MKNILLMILAIGISIFSYNWFSERYQIIPKKRIVAEQTAVSATPTSTETPTETTTPTPPPTPEQQVSAVFNKSIIQAEEIAEIYQKFPQLVTQELRYRLIRVEGIAHKIMLTGINKNKAEITMRTNGSIKIVLVEDLHLKMAVPSAKHVKPSLRWEIANRRLYLVSKNEGTPEHVVTEGDSIKPVKVRMDKITPATLYFEVEPEQ
jgi:hypothetical protein